jgi:hypothetical protein
LAFAVAVDQLQLRDHVQAKNGEVLDIGSFSF